MATVRQYLAPEEAQFLATAFPQLSKVNGTNFPVVGLAFDAAATETAYWHFAAFSYGSGNVTVDVEWYADTASSGVCRWEAAIAATTPNTDTDNIETKAFATATAFDDTHLGTTGQRLHEAPIVVTNLDAIAANDEVWLKVSRLGAHANDTMTGDAILSSVRVSYSDT
jgi:hypothetical protein